jgi:hypothetical protein
MTLLSLQEAAQQIGASRVDIWRAIQTGALSAERTDDGGFAIDSAALSRVFESAQPEKGPTEQDATASPEPSGEPEANAAPESAATNDIAAAFAELQDQLKGLLAPLAEVKADDELGKDKDERLDVTADNVMADKAATEANGANDGVEAAIPVRLSEEAAETPPKRPWWRRLVD